MKLKKRLASIMLIASLLTGCSTGGNSSTKDGKETITVWAWDKNFNIDLKNMYTENEKEMILDAISRFGDEKVSAIKKVMPDYVKYESIRAVILEKYLY